MRASFLRVLPLLAVFVACSSSPRPIHASDYDQSCAVDADCVAVADGDACNPCGWNDDECMAMGVLSVHDKPRFVADRAKLHDECAPTIGSQSCSAICVTVAFACVAGRCALCHGQSGCGPSDAGTD
jgi:hypothetical protein